MTGPLPAACDDADPVLRDEAMVSRVVVKNTQMRHSFVVDALRLVIAFAALILQPAVEPGNTTRDAKVKSQRRGDILVVITRLRMTSLDFVVSHTPDQSYVHRAAREDGRARRGSNRAAEAKQVPAGCTQSC